MVEIIHQSQSIYNSLRKINLCEVYSRRIVKHIMAIVISMFTLGYKGKTTDMARCSSHHRTTIAHFLNHGKWDENVLEGILKAAVIRNIYEEAERSGKPILCIVDDTIASKTKPSSQALHPIEDAYFHYSHLKRKKDYGHQAMSVLLSCNGLTLNYATILYDKSRSKIQMVCDIAAELPVPPVVSYFLCDSWYTSTKVMDSFIQKGFYTIGALKANRVIYPRGIRQKISAFALHLRKTDSSVRLVTVGSRQYYVYRYEGSLNDIEDAVVLLTYPKDVFLKPGALRAFICMDASLSTDEILDIYAERWAIEVYFRQCKNTLAFDKYQIRSSLGIRRFWLLTALAHFICCVHAVPDRHLSFEEGFSFFSQEIGRERISFIYYCGVCHAPLDEVLNLIA